MNDTTKATEAAASADWDHALAEQTAAGGNGKQPQGADVQPAQFGKLQAEAGGVLQEGGNLDMVLDIPVTVSMEIGRTNMNIRNLLQLNQGSVVELDRLAGEPMDVLVNGTLIAHGKSSSSTKNSASA